MVDSREKLTPTKSFYESEEISMPEMRSGTQLVREGRRRPDPEVPVRTDPLPVQGTGGRDYGDALRSACAGCHAALRGDQDSKMPDGSKKLSSPAHTYRGDCGANWIKGKRNGIARRNFDG